MSLNRISISNSRDHQLQAARTLSQTLTDLGWNHAFIGGFAWSMLGSQRPTEDIDILIEVKTGENMMELRTRLQELDAHFANADFKFYYVRDPDPRLVKDPETLVKRSKQNVLVETLTAGRLGLPEIAGPTFIEPELGVIILHPSILILTKFKRWSSSRSSTRPQTLKKFRTDQQDIIFLIQWLASEELKIEFDKYIGKPKDELLRMVLTFHRKFEEEDPELVETLESVVHPEDWQALLLLSPLEVESHIPPSDA